MTEFPRHLLVPANARYWAHSGPTQQAAILIPLRSFLLDEKPVETSIRLDGIALDMDDLRSQENRRHRFPANPQEGYIDGSLYLLGRHIPVDVTELSFGTLAPEGFPMRMAGAIAFAAAGILEWPDTPVELDFTLGLPPTPAQIDAAIALALAATGARSVRDVGRVMAWLVREHPGWDDRRRLHERLSQHLAAR